MLRFYVQFMKVKGKVPHIKGGIISEILYHVLNTKFIKIVNVSAREN